MRLLLTDIMFPNDCGKWRLVITKALMDAHETDVYIPVGAPTWKPTYESLRESHGLDRYDVLIFDPAYNHLDAFNEPAVGGTSYNGAHPGRYLLRRKERRGEAVDFRAYDLVYHLFYLMYQQYMFYHGPANGARQVIHMFPGGGIYTAKQRLVVDADALLVLTHPDIAQHALATLPNECVITPTVPILYEGEIVAPRTPRGGGASLCVCFTSVGPLEFKGGHQYCAIAALYSATHPDDPVEFIAVGTAVPSEMVTQIGRIPQKDLDALYDERVDILVSLDTNRMINGFPLGLEALSRGVVVLTADVAGVNQRHAVFSAADGVHVVGLNDPAESVALIHAYCHDRALLHERGLAGQAFVARTSCHAKHMGPILAAMESRATALGPIVRGA